MKVRVSIICGDCDYHQPLARHLCWRDERGVFLTGDSIESSHLRYTVLAGNRVVDNESTLALSEDEAVRLTKAAHIRGHQRIECPRCGLCVVAKRKNYRSAVELLVGHGVSEVSLTTLQRTLDLI